LAEVYAWDLSLAVNEKRQYKESVNVIFKAFILQPHNLKYLKAAITTSVNLLLFKLKIIKFLIFCNYLGHLTEKMSGSLPLNNSYSASVNETYCFQVLGR